MSSGYYSGHNGSKQNMNNYTLYKKVLITFSISTFILISQFLCLRIYPVFADDCEILNVQMFQREQPVIVTDWHMGIPYKKYKIETYPCANITFRNNARMSTYSTDIEVTATFTDQSTKAKNIECDKKHLEPGEEYICSVCFESDFPISNLICRFR